MKNLFAILMVLSLLLVSFSVCSVTASAAPATHTVTFDVQGIGETPDPVTVADGESYLYLGDKGADNPTADGYVFHCWVTTLDYEPDEVVMSNTAAYLETPIYEDITLYAVWYKILDKIDVTVDPPVPGDVIGTKQYENEDISFEYQYPRPNAKVTSEGARVQENFWSVIGTSAYWIDDPTDNESTFKGTFENGREYGFVINIEPIFGYEFASSVTVTLNGVALEKPLYSDREVCTVQAPILCGNAVPAETVTKDSRKNTAMPLRIPPRRTSHP